MHRSAFEFGNLDSSGFRKARRVMDQEILEGEYEGMLKATEQELNVRKRDGRVVSFDSTLISNAIKKAFVAERKLKEM